MTPWDVHHTIALQSDGSTSMNTNGSGFKDDGSAYTLNCIDRQSVVCVGSGQANAMISSEVCATLNCAKELPYVIDRASFNQGENAKYDPHIEKTDVMDTLVARGPHAVCSGSDGWIVRRLTPTEFERLQGFSDGWTSIEWNGRPAGECPDGPRYKACGNSMAVPVMRWLGERLEMVDEILMERGDWGEE